MCDQLNKCKCGSDAVEIAFSDTEGSVFCMDCRKKLVKKQRILPGGKLAQDELRANLFYTEAHRALKHTLVQTWNT